MNKIFFDIETLPATVHGLVAIFELSLDYNLIKVDLTPLEIEDMVANPARDQRTPRQSHSSGSYLETGMGRAERSYRNGEEPFVI